MIYLLEACMDDTNLHKASVQVRVMFMEHNLGVLNSQVGSNYIVYCQLLSNSSLIC